MTAATSTDRLRARERMLWVLLGVITLFVAGFVATVAIVLVTSKDQTIKANETAYGNALALNVYAQSSCQRGLFDRTENIESDRRAARFFAAASKARAAGGTKLDIETARKYADYSMRSSQAADRREMRLLGASLKTLEMKVIDDRGRPVPAKEALAEATRVCRSANPVPKREPEPPLITIAGLEIG